MTSSSVSFYSRLRTSVSVVIKHATKHTGVGLVCSVAYFDPGNWGVDLQAGSQFGYKLLFVVLVSGLFAVYMQVISSRLGCVTGLDLATHCRLLLHDRPKHTLRWRWLVLYPLYILAEVAIIATDLAELLGSAIALNLLFPRLPLWAGVLVTASDVLFLLAMRNPLGAQPVRMFEIIVAALVFTVLICMAIIISRSGVHWGEAFFGFVPSKDVVSSSGLYTSIGILGATVMPHSLFLGSALSTQEREKPHEDQAIDCFSVKKIVGPAGDAKNHTEWENHSWAFVHTHLYHGIVDMCISLIGIAVVINAMILILASATFYYGFGQTGNESPATLFDAYDLLKQILGTPVAITFALALLASGQSSSIIATLAGQTVSEGFINWHMSPVMRRLLTRCLGLIPSMAVAAGLGKPGISALLVISQVVLSIVLPFVVYPLIYITSSKRFMSVKNPVAQRSDGETSSVVVAPDQSNCACTSETKEAAEDLIDCSNGWIMTILGWIMWVIIVLANAYAIVTLAMGED
ncbi:hypothetical protein IEO21_02285 [Rhodonia placenta]|uniref:Uncharacterized protein n=1 Tax=Rhodonia placenta TaxID=104341 RepID=A0A8H7P806_9APHY|nr:hypothetical protein IEO21_02285 [Postia placenta]